MKHVRYPYLALEMILAGEMEFHTENRRQIAGPGSLYVIPPGTTVKFRCHTQNDVRKLAVLMDGENLRAIMITLHMPGCRLLHLTEPDVMEKKIRALRDIINASLKDNSAGSYRFLLDLVELAGQDKLKITPFSQAAAIMEANFQENLRISDIATRTGICESTLRKLFQSELRCSPLEYLNSIRLNFAMEKLRHTSLRIKEIAQMSGFLSSARFCTLFQEKYRMSPGQFRQKTQNDAAKTPAPSK